MNAHKLAARLRAIATRIENIVSFMEKFTAAISFLFPQLKEIRHEIELIRAIADELKPRKVKK